MRKPVRWKLSVKIDRGDSSPGSGEWWKENWPLVKGQYEPTFGFISLMWETYQPYPQMGKMYSHLYEQNHLSCHQPKPTSEPTKRISIPSELHRSSKAVNATHRRGKWSLVVNTNHSLKASGRVPYLFEQNPVHSFYYSVHMLWSIFLCTVKMCFC